MIEMPRRSVTRFFIPLIDVLTLLFCIYLLMPVVQEEGSEGTASGPLQTDERRELNRLRLQNDGLRAEVARLRQGGAESPRLSIRMLQTGDKGRLYFSDPKRPSERIEVTAATVEDFLREQQQQAAGRELYFLIVTPRVGSEVPTYPLRFQLEEYDRWFDAYAHGHIYYALPGNK
jgi:hypothetical protein